MKMECNVNARNQFFYFDGRLCVLNVNKAGFCSIHFKKNYPSINLKSHYKITHINLYTQLIFLIAKLFKYPLTS